MIRTKKAMKVLNKSEQRHLTEMGINSLRAMERQVQIMKKAEKEKSTFVCWECKNIARKLDLWKEQS